MKDHSLGLLSLDCVAALAELLLLASHLTQHVLKLSLEVAILTLECLILRQRHFQASFQW